MENKEMQEMQEMQGTRDAALPGPRPGPGEELRRKISEGNRRMAAWKREMGLPYHSRTRRDKPRHYKLTAHEDTIREMLMRGCPRTEIAARLGVTPVTLTAHIRRRGILEELLALRKAGENGTAPQDGTDGREDKDGSPARPGERGQSWR